MCCFKGQSYTTQPSDYIIYDKPLILDSKKENDANFFCTEAVFVYASFSYRTLQFYMC